MMTAARLAQWGLGLEAAQVPPPARAAAVRHLLDGAGAAVGAARRWGDHPAVQVAADLAGPEQATILGRSPRVSAPAAALANGTLLHAMDFDDTHAGGLVHATAVVLPAVLAVGEEVDATGEEALVAALAGFEVACRLAAAAPHAFHARGLHATAAVGVFSSAMVASRLLGLDEPTTVNALGIAGSQAGGLLEFLATGASTKQLHPGFAGHAGILAARLAHAGATGPESVIEGRHGLFAALLDHTVDTARITDGLGERWEVERITLKPYPACQLVHVSLDAARSALQRAGRSRLERTEVESVRVRVHPDCVDIVCEPREDKVAPRTSYDAKFSLPWSLAALLMDGEIELATYAEDSIARAEVAEFAGRVVIEVQPSEGVAADAPGHVEIRLADGRRLLGEVSRSAGGPDQPLTDDEVDRKFLANCEEAPGAPDLIRSIRQLTDEPSVRALASALSAVATREEDR
ncbi:MmgE/PrpD family protein [Ornithinimicrobium faecis]|uniref:MmgE/PrpD family protein n=1 Tax=Ornithinimicrobium faecis TaxID=2934158 RepID=UPI002117BB86|nr:MmgE/PrpD family protein [Ornithinimicrobium sp. HY1745]